jgi:hypothetical protein
MSEEACIITSLNLYEFSQVNNNEMGVLITRTDDADMYRDAHDEAQRIIRISDEVRISLETVASVEEAGSATTAAEVSENTARDEKLTTSKLAKKHGLKTSDFLAKMVEDGCLSADGDEYSLTQKGVALGAEAKSGRYGDYFIWPSELSI